MDRAKIWLEYVIYRIAQDIKSATLGCMSAFLIVPPASGLTAIEADETLTSVVVRTFPTELAARRWALERVESLALEEQASIREEILAERASIQEEIIDTLTGSFTVH